VRRIIRTRLPPPPGKRVILTESLNYVGAEIVTTILAPGVHRRGKVSERADLMAAPRRVGREVVEG
jgi:hypothetical protein